MRADDASFGHDPSIAEVVPAVGHSVVVGVGLEVIERGRRGPLDQCFLGDRPRPDWPEPCE